MQNCVIQVYREKRFPEEWLSQLANLVTSKSKLQVHFHSRCLLFSNYNFPITIQHMNHFIESWKNENMENLGLANPRDLVQNGEKVIILNTFKVSVIGIFLHIFIFLENTTCSMRILCHIWRTSNKYVYLETPKNDVWKRNETDISIRESDTGCFSVENINNGCSKCLLFVQHMNCIPYSVTSFYFQHLT